MTNRQRYLSLLQFLPVRDVGWTEDQAVAFLVMQEKRAENAARRLLKTRPAGAPAPTTPEGFMAIVEGLLDEPNGQAKRLVTNPERRALHLWHRLYRASSQV